jgi:uncharacterized protein YqhQ
MYAAGIRSLRLDFSRKEVQKMRNRKKAQKAASLVMAVMMTLTLVLGTVVPVVLQTAAVF